MHKPTWTVFFGLAIGLTSGGCSRPSWNLVFDDSGDCPWRQLLHTAGPLRASEGDGFLYGLCSDSECGETHPLAVGAEGDFTAFISGIDPSQGGTLKSSDTRVFQVSQDPAQRDTCFLPHDELVTHPARLKVVGPGEADIELRRDGELMARWHFHAAAINSMKLRPAHTAIERFLLADGGAALADAGVDLDGGSLIPGYFERGGVMVAQPGYPFEAKLEAIDDQGRRLVVGAGPSNHATLVASELHGDPVGFVQIAPPHGGANVIYDVKTLLEGSVTLEGSFPDHGVSARLQLEVLDRDAYAQAYAEHEL